MSINFWTSSGLGKAVWLFIFFVCLEAFSFAAAARNWNFLTACLTCLALVTLVILILTLIKMNGYLAVRLLIGSAAAVYTVFMIYQLIQFIANFD